MEASDPQVAQLKEQVAKEKEKAKENLKKVMKLKQEKMAAHVAKEARNASHSKLVESEKNVERLKRQNEALLQELVELYMKMQARAALPYHTPDPAAPTSPTSSSV